MSAKFKDLKGRELTCLITVATMKELRDDLQVDIGDVADGKLFDRLSSDSELLVNVIGVVCKKSIADHNITEALDLAESFGGDTLEAAFDAFWEAVADFTPSRKRSLLRDLIAKSVAVEGAAMDRATTRLAKLNPAEIAEEVMAKLEAEAEAKKAESTSTSGPGN